MNNSQKIAAIEKYLNTGIIKYQPSALRSRKLRKLIVDIHICYPGHLGKTEINLNVIYERLLLLPCNEIMKQTFLTVSIVIILRLLFTILIYSCYVII